MGSGGLVGGLAGLFGLAILATAAVGLITVMGNLFGCSVCGYKHRDKQVVMRHIQTVHPEEVRRASSQNTHAKRPAWATQQYRLGQNWGYTSPSRNTAPSRRRSGGNTDWVYDWRI